MGGFSDFFEAIFGGQSQGRRGRHGGETSARGEDIEAEIALSLEEAHRGGSKKIFVEVGHDRKNLDVKIPPGVREGSKIRLAGQGYPDGGKPGDLYLVVRIKPHPRFRVEGNDVYVIQTIYPWDAVLGTEIQVDTLDEPVRLKIPPGSQGGQKLRLKEKGLSQKRGERGNFYVTLQIVLPEKTGEKEKAIYAQLKAIHGH
jgi:curved DNA-binding protein